MNPHALHFSCSNSRDTGANAATGCAPPARDAIDAQCRAFVARSAITERTISATCRT